ncbi:MAG TPA: HD-GYP domain-containing protein [Candidatus Dormibacteraeota bacterium]|jgi:ribonuclease P protein subunit RPR2|nr:HD-GYP domain-containing protein [Candidatus Dormibacteraeota bacterium]
MAVQNESWLDTRSLAILDRLTRSLHRAASAPTFAEVLRSATDELSQLLNTPEVSVSLRGPRRDPGHEDGWFRPGEPPRHLEIPLTVERSRIGAIRVALREPGRMFGTEEVRVVELFAGLLASAYQRDSLRDRLAGETRRRQRKDAELRQAQEATVRILAQAVELRDGYTGLHIQRVADYAMTLHEMVSPGTLVYEEAIGFTVHDIGKLGVPDAVLLKPGPLDPDEQKIMRKHPIIGSALIQNLDFLNRSVPLVRHHHERWDGLGYPDGLAEDEIPLTARVFSVADSFDAATTDRPYRPARPVREAAADIVAGAGRAYDPDVIEAFAHAIERETLLSKVPGGA